jgi:hypothetical protein
MYRSLGEKTRILDQADNAELVGLAVAGRVGRHVGQHHI